MTDRRAERRALLIAAAYRLFGEGGEAALSVRSVCRESELNSRYFYESFADVDELLGAAETLVDDGFTVLAYSNDDPVVARHLAELGCAAVMPLGAPIGSNRGLLTKEFIQILVDEIDLPIIVDAGIGRPSQACEAMELGVDAIMANTAIATSGDVALMAKAFKHAIEAGRAAYLAGLGRVLESGAEASSPLTGFLEE
ncbi:MAG: TetR family transcriptional regulator [Bacillales bacterium]